MEILKKRVPEVDVEVMTPNMLIGLGLMKTDRYAKNGIGWIDEKKMCDSVDLVNTYMGLPKKVECKDVYSTEFFTKVEMPKLIDWRRVSVPTRTDRPRQGRHDVQAASGPVEALADISLAVGAGEFVSLVGPSGCGKSTLLRIVAGLRPATRGTITVAGRDGDASRSPTSAWCSRRRSC